MVKLVTKQGSIIKVKETEFTTVGYNYKKAVIVIV